jgi:hypothetical protein
VLLFVDIDGVLRPLPRRGKTAWRTHKPLQPFPFAGDFMEALGPCLPGVDIVLTSDQARGRSLAELRLALPDLLAERVTGSIWEHVAPKPLTRLGQMSFWLRRTYLRRPPTWLALESDLSQWPARYLNRVIPCYAPMSSPETRTALTQALARYYWMERWWGEGASPAAEDLRRAHAVMHHWQVRPEFRSRVLGSTREEFEERLELLLTIFAGPNPRPSLNGYSGQWLNFEAPELDCRRPIDVMSEDGVPGIRQVLNYVWKHAAPESAPEF